MKWSPPLVMAGWVVLGSGIGFGIGVLLASKSRIDSNLAGGLVLIGVGSFILFLSLVAGGAAKP